MRSTHLGAFVVVGALIINACAGGPGATSSSPSATAPSSVGPGETVQITVGTDTDAELKFDPGELTVPAGADVRVTFENRASVPHNLTFQGPINVATSTVVAPGTSETLEFKAPAPGEYTFVCTLHPGMSGKLIVSGA
jgi:plastocyanin